MKTATLTVSIFVFVCIAGCVKDDSVSKFDYETLKLKVEHLDRMSKHQLRLNKSLSKEMDMYRSNAKHDRMEISEIVLFLSGSDGVWDEKERKEFYDKSKDIARKGLSELERIQNRQ